MLLACQHNNETQLILKTVSLKQGHVMSSSFRLVTTLFCWSFLVGFLSGHCKCSYFLLFRYTCLWVWEQVSARGSRGSGHWPVTSGGWWPVRRGSVWSGARWRTLWSVTSLRWEHGAGATFRAQSLGSITLQANNYHNTIPRSRTSVMMNLIVLTHWALHGTSLQICEI